MRCLLDGIRAVGSFMNKFLRVTIMVLALNFMFTIMQTAISKNGREDVKKLAEVRGLQTRVRHQTNLTSEIEKRTRVAVINIESLYNVDTNDYEEFGDIAPFENFINNIAAYVQKIIDGNLL